MATVPLSWPDAVPADTAKSGLAAVDFTADARESDSEKIDAGADSSGFQTDRRDAQERPDKKAGKVEEQRRRICPKFHTVAPPGPQLTHSCRIAGGDVPDTTQLPTLADLTTKRHGDAFRGMRFVADRGYDSGNNDKCVHEGGMRPNTRQCKPQPGAHTNRGKPHRRRAAEEFDADTYGRRGLTEGLFGGGGGGVEKPPAAPRASRGDARERWGPVTATERNPAVPDRPECAGETGVDWTAAARGAAAT